MTDKKSSLICMALLLAALAILANCSPTVADATPTAGPEAPANGISEAIDRQIAPLTEEALWNGTYLLRELGEVQLVDGEYRHAYGEGASMVDLVTLQTAAFGELNRDGLDDAAIILWHSGGGSGAFAHLVVVVNENGTPRQVGAEFLGDRWQIDSLAIEGNQVVLTALTHGPDDPMCCPSLSATLTFAVKDGALVKAGEVVATPEAPAAVESLEETIWTLVSFRNAAGEAVALVPGSQITAEFTADRIGGNAGCNSYFSPYQIGGGNTLMLGPIGSTLMMCADEAVMTQEVAYLAALESVASFDKTDDGLQLLDAAGEVVATYEVLEPAPLSGTTWELTGLSDGTGGVSSLLVGSRITALFGEDGEVRGSAGCNEYRASFEVGGDTIAIGPAVSTRMACGEPVGVMEQENAFLAALAASADYEIRGDQLTLFDAKGAQTVSFRKALETAEERAGRRRVAMAAI